MNVSATTTRPGAIVWLILGCGIVAALHLGKTAIATPMLVADMHLSLGEVGWLTGIVAVLGLVGGAPAGVLVAAVGSRRSMLLGLGILVFSDVLGAVAPAFPVLLATRLVEGLGFLLIIVAGPALIQGLTTAAQRDMAFSLWSCFMPCGIALAMLVGPLFTTWQSFWWANSGLALTFAVMVIVGVPHIASGSGRSLSHMIGAIRCLFCSRGTVLLAVAFALYSLMFFALFSFIPVLLMERMDVSYRTAGLLSALASAINAGGNLAAGYLVARGATKASLIVIASGLMGVSGVGIFLGSLPAMPTFMLCLLFSAAGGLIPATLLICASLVAPHATLVPVAVGLMMQGSNLGQLLGPVVIGSVTAAFGWSAAGAVVVLAAIATCVAALLLRPATAQRANLTGV